MENYESAEQQALAVRARFSRYFEGRARERSAEQSGPLARVEDRSDQTELAEAA